MTTADIEALIHDGAWVGREAGLNRIEALLNRLGNPQKTLKFVHIAGTNGKGSTAAMLASVLQSAGYRTALFTSPHLTHLGERFQIDGIPMADADLERVANDVLSVSADIQPTEFELMTAMGLLHFARQHCDIVVLEVGLGGRLDSTNIIPAPEVAVITNIGFDHVALLGDTLAKIAAEKAGILKAGSRCVLYHQTEEVMDVVRTQCMALHIPCAVTRPNEVDVCWQAVTGQSFTYRDRTVSIGLLGNHQIQNATLVLEVVDCLQSIGWDIPMTAIADGLSGAKWTGRMELLRRHPDFIVDGGHNVQCVESLMDGLQTLYPHQKFIFLMGVLADKNVDEMLDLAIPLARRVVTITPDSPRALDGQALAQMIASRGVPAVAAHSVAGGVQAVLAEAGEGDVVVAFGSLYTVGTIKAILN